MPNKENLIGVIDEGTKTTRFVVSDNINALKMCVLHS